jgi:hypothetical protein
MYAPFDDDTLYCIWDLKDPVVFFKNVGCLLGSEESVLGLVNYGPDERVGLWMRSVKKVSAPKKFDFQELARIYAENEMAGCIHFRATKSNLTDPIRLAGEVDEYPVCDHLIGFKDETSIFSFHDAFRRAEMYISSAVPEARVDAFCAGTNTKPTILPNPQKNPPI